MTDENDRDEYPYDGVINARLAEVAAAAPTPLSWVEAWTGLGRKPTADARLAVYQAIRSAGSIPDEAGFFLVAWVLDLVTQDRTSEGMREAEEWLEEVRLKYGIDEDASALEDDMPAEYQEAMDRSHEAWDDLTAATMEEVGERDMARLFREEPDEFERRYEAGRQFFHGAEEEAGPNIEEWFDQLQDVVTTCIEADSLMGPLGLRYEMDGDTWDVWMYPTPVELIGGAYDGGLVVPGFHVDLEQLRSAFETVLAFGWNPLGVGSIEGPHVSIEGVFLGRKLFLQVLAVPPDNEEPGLKLDTTKHPRKPE